MTSSVSVSGCLAFLSVKLKYLHNMGCCPFSLVGRGRPASTGRDELAMLSAFSYVCFNKRMRASRGPRRNTHTGHELPLATISNCKKLKRADSFTHRDPSYCPLSSLRNPKGRSRGVYRSAERRKLSAARVSSQSRSQRKS